MLMTPSPRNGSVFREFGALILSEASLCKSQNHRNCAPFHPESLLRRTVLKVSYQGGIAVSGRSFIRSRDGSFRALIFAVQ